MKIDDAKIRTEKTNNLKSSVLYAKRPSIFTDQNRFEIIYVDINKLVPYSKQARRVFNEDEINSLSQTIKEHGIRQPLTILPSTKEDGVFEVISGERRLRAAKIVGLNKVPCIILNDAAKAEEIALVENIQRKELHPVELSRALNALLLKNNWGGQKELSQKLGLTSSQISELLKINSLSSDVAEFVLARNFRGRDNFRKLYTFESDEDKKAFVLSQTMESIDPAVKKNNKNNTKSLLRVFLMDGELKTQSSNLYGLEPERKHEIIQVLERVLVSLKD